MKRAVGFIMVLALAGLYAACDSGNTTSDQDIVIPTDTKDATDVKDTGKDTVTDTSRDEQTDTTTDTNPPPDATDPGQDTNPPPTDNGTDTTPPTDNGTDTTPPVDVVTDTNPDTTGCVDDPVGSCKAVYACYGECPTSGGSTDQACLQDCQSKLSPEGQADYQAFASCLQQYCASTTTDDEFYACLEEKCINQYYGCFWGCQYTKCSDLVGCLNSCPADNPSTTTVDEQSVCIGDCWGGGTSEAQIDLQNVITCANNACPVCQVANPTAAQQNECNTCFNDSFGGTCASLWAKCESFGTKKCGEMLTCVNACTDSTCAQACLSEGTKTAGTLWNAMIECANTACPVCDVANPTQAQIDECNTCFNTALNSGGTCESQTQACANDQAAS